MDIKPGYALKDGQLADPILWRWATAMPEINYGRVMSMLAEHLGGGRSKRLTTWGRDPAAPDGPHWIGVRHGTPLHVDPRYPRYTHQLVVHNRGWGVAGIERTIMGAVFVPGTVFCCDTHSPHILLADGRAGSLTDYPYYLAASMDARSQIAAETVIPALARFVADWARLC